MELNFISAEKILDNPELYFAHKNSPEKNREGFETLEEHGLGDIIKRTVNAQTLNGAMAGLVEENDGELPEDFESFIKPYQYYDVGKRKETNKAAKNAKEKKEG